MNDKSTGIMASIHCNSCLQKTNHEYLNSSTHTETDEDGQVYSTTYDMLQCRGCDGVTFRITETALGSPGKHLRYFPPRISRPKPKWLDELWGIEELDNEVSITSLMDEVYSALHSGSRRLAMMGARALIDIVMTDKIGNEGSFNGRLNKLTKEGFVSEKNSAFLKTALEAGHAAAHRGHCPSSEDVNQVMDIVENVIQAVYMLEGAAKSLAKTTPQRKKVVKNEDS